MYNEIRSWTDGRAGGRAGGRDGRAGGRTAGRVDGRADGRPGGRAGRAGNDFGAALGDQMRRIILSISSFWYFESKNNEEIQSN